MIRLRFNKTCKDKYNATFYSNGMIKEFEDDRAMEILATGCANEVEKESENQVDVNEHINEVEKESEKARKENDESNNETIVEVDAMVNLNDLSIKELKELAKEVGVKTTGKKEELIERLLASQEG